MQASGEASTDQVISAEAPAAIETVSPVEALDRWTGDPRFMQSLARGLLVLGVVARGEGRPVAAKQVVSETGLSLASAHRCLYTLHATGYVRSNRNGAVPGTTLAALAHDFAASSPLVARCGPILDRLHAELGVTISLATFDGAEPTIVASSTSEALLKLDLRVGASVPMHCSSAGKIFLASLTPKVLAGKLKTMDFKAYTERTISSAAQIELQLAGVRRQGYAVVDQELAVGVRSASAPVKDPRGVLAGSINATMLVGAVTLRDLRSTIVPALLTAASELSGLLA